MDSPVESPESVDGDGPLDDGPLDDVGRPVLPLGSRVVPAGSVVVVGLAEVAVELPSLVSSSFVDSDGPHPNNAQHISHARVRTSPV